MSTNAHDSNTLFLLSGIVFLLGCLSCRLLLLFLLFQRPDAAGLVHDDTTLFHLSFSLSTLRYPFFFDFLLKDVRWRYAARRRPLDITNFLCQFCLEIHGFNGCCLFVCFPALGIAATMQCCWFFSFRIYGLTP